jgi:hypothetical protein
VYIKVGADPVLDCRATSAGIQYELNVSLNDVHMDFCGDILEVMLARQ